MPPFYMIKSTTYSGTQERNNNYIMNKLKDIRESLSMSQKELAKEVGVNHRTISAYENEVRRLPVETAKKIGEVLNVDWWKLYEE